MIEITLLSRKYNSEERSIERLFYFLKKGFLDKNVNVKEVKNPYGGGLLNIFKSILFFGRQIKREEIVHITGQIHFVAALLKTKKIVITVHDLGLYRGLPAWRFFAFKLFWIYIPFRRAKRIIAISEKTKQEIVSIMPSVLHKIEVIPNCVTIPIEDEVFLKKNKLPQVLIIGTRSNKNIERGIKALKGLPVELMIIGALTDSQKLLLEENNISYKNEVQVNEERLLEVYKKVDILLFPSIYEGFGLPIIEAQAQNVMVITSDVSPTRDVAADGAVLVNPENENLIREALLNILSFTDEEKLALLRKGKENVKNYTVETITNHYINVYNKI